MRKKDKKLISILLAFFMIFSISFVTPINVQANEINKNNIEIESLFRESLNEYKEEHKLAKVEKYDPDEKATFIVQLDDKALSDYIGNKSIQEGIENTELEKKVLKSQEYCKNEIRKMDSKCVFNNDFTLLINGFSVETKKSYMKKIGEIQGVKHVSIAKKYYRDVKNAIGIGEIKNIYEQYGYDGEGMVVSVIDSGIDYTHKDMVLSNPSKSKLTEKEVGKIKESNKKVKGKYFTEKIPYGYNFADRNFEIIDKASENIGYMHGMHVAGIVGANCRVKQEIENNKGIKGVAPECQIIAMKVFSNDSDKIGASEENIIAAIEDSVAHGADVINMSFCSDAGFQDPEEGQQQAIKAAIEKGIMVVSAAGNAWYSTFPDKHEGVLDLGVVGAPGLAHHSIQVASLNNSKRTAYTLTYNSNDGQGLMPYVESDFDIKKLQNEYELVDCGLGRSIEHGNVDEFSGKELKGKIALIKRGEIDFKYKKLNAQNAGAKAVIIYNGDDDESYLNNISTDSKVNIPTIFIKNSDGVKLKNVVSKNLKISFKGEILEVPNENNFEMSGFSSWGPTPNLDLKPDISGVGGNVWSTVNDNSYKNMTGTSMASPYIAGITTLILQHVNKLGIKFDSNEDKVKFVKHLVMNTAEVQIDTKHDSLPYSPRRQGAGLVNTKNALKNKVLLSYKGDPSASLKVIERVTEIPLELKNYGDKAITYNIEVPSGVLTEVDTVKGDMPYELKLKDAKLEFNKTITVNPGETVKINGKLILGEGVSKNKFVEGFIKLNPINGDEPSIGMPFMGFYGAWDELQIVDNPIYTGKSIFGETSLYTAKPGSMGYRTYYLGGGKDGKPENFAINPEDPKANNNVMPQMSFLRNAKSLRIDVSDESGQVLKIIEDKKDIRKEIPIMQQIASKVNFDWLWDGRIYDKYKGERVPVDEGQYYINIRVKADIDNAKEQILTFPIKVDKTAPTVKVPKIFIADSSNCNIEFEALDYKNGSGIEHFLFLVNGQKYMEGEDKKLFKLEKDKVTGSYNKNLKLPIEDGKSSYEVHIGASDYADNMGVGNALIICPSNSKIDMKLNKEVYKEGEEILLEYKPQNALDESSIDHYEVITDNNESSKINGKNLSYTIKNGLLKGEHCIAVKAIDAKGKVLDANAIKLNIEKAQEGDLDGKEIKIENITGKREFYNGKNAEIKIKASNLTDTVKKLNFSVCLYNEREALINTCIIEKEIEGNEDVVLSSSLAIPKEGDFKIKVFFLDSFDNLNKLAETAEYKVKR
ncbi:S8 family serine peptidase [Hathewaya massiliensis]|uniref:S8 family serine peptidase n=1 Tax=Hathewaya massiliensis TaxID=1964382 RepID=UPI00115854BD|nr:S8 family serine peptidase [Hathewaya massiliensis]